MIEGNQGSLGGRWSTYFLRRGAEFTSFWKEYLNYRERDLLLVAGVGFDPRASFGLARLLELGGAGERDCVAVELDEGPESPSRKYASRVDDNRASIENLLLKRGQKIVKHVTMRSLDGRRIGSRSATDIFLSLSELTDYTDVVVDISALPRGIYFPLIGKILHLIDRANPEGTKPPPNLHAIVSENAELDGRIRDEGIDEDAAFLHGFTGSLDTEASAKSPKVWIPILGERQREQLERIDNLIHADEVCPMLPMPSANARRGDDLLIEYRELLFDRIGIEPKNLIYVAERDPFQAYNEIRRTILRYKTALEPLGGCQVVVSALSSKLLSIGGLLAAYELKHAGRGVGIAHVETDGYTIEGDVNQEEELAKTELSSLWLAGDCYG